jgi:DNA-binding LytR/AlgR family response regulator
MKKNCYVVDDEQSVIDEICQHLEKTGLFDVVGTSTSPTQAIIAILELQPDLVITDVQMPEMDGTKMAAIIQQTFICKYIFITGHTDYALASFSVDVIHYLLKPISYSDLYAALMKYLRITGYNQLEEKVPVNAKRLLSLPVTVLANDELTQIQFEQIAYIQSLQKYATLFLRDGRSIQIKESLKGLIRSLPENKFIRAHRSYIISIDGLKLAHFTAQNLYLPYADRYVPVNRETRKYLKELLHKEIQ